MTSLLDNLPHTTTARRRKRVSDGMGGSVDTFDTVVFTDTPCWRMKATDREVHWWQQRNIEITDRFFFSADPELDVNCVLDINGWRFDVMSYAEPDDSAGLGILYRVMARRLAKLTA
jgi:hypothetical protein